MQRRNCFLFLFAWTTAVLFPNHLHLCVRFYCCYYCYKRRGRRVRLVRLVRRVVRRVRPVRPVRRVRCYYCCCCCQKRAHDRPHALCCSLIFFFLTHVFHVFDCSLTADQDSHCNLYYSFLFQSSSEHLGSISDSRGAATFQIQTFACAFHSNKTVAFSFSSAFWISCRVQHLPLLHCSFVPVLVSPIK